MLQACIDLLSEGYRIDRLLNAAVEALTDALGLWMLSFGARMVYVPSSAR